MCQVSRSSINPFTKSSDSFQAKDNGQGMFTRKIYGKHRPQEGEAKWFQVEREP
jgi:hypothetical protein